jgi:hypothetical protein
MMAWTIFLNPIHLHHGAALWLVIPLCASVAVVYKALRVPSIRELPRAAAGLLLYMVGGLAVLGAALWALHRYWLR